MVTATNDYYTNYSDGENYDYHYCAGHGHGPYYNGDDNNDSYYTTLCTMSALVKRGTQPFVCHWTLHGCYATATVANTQPPFFNTSSANHTCHVERRLQHPPRYVCRKFKPVALVHGSFCPYDKTCVCVYATRVWSLIRACALSTCINCMRRQAHGTHRTGQADIAMCTCVES